MNLLLKKNFKVHIFDTCPRGDVRADTLMNYLQETASEHADQSAFSIKELFAQGKTWVLSRYHLQIIRSPKLWEDIEVSTWPSGQLKRFATREFEVLSHTGESLARATTSWAAIDLHTHRLIPPSEIVPPNYAIPKRVIDDSFPSLPKFESEKSDNKKIFPVMIRDLDINNHVNNTVYVQWAVEAIPTKTLSTMQLQSIEIAYHGEAKYGDQITSHIVRLDDFHFLHKIVHTETGTELTRLKTSWMLKN